MDWIQYIIGNLFASLHYVLYGIISKEYTGGSNTSLLLLHPKELMKIHDSIAKRTIWGSVWNLLAGSLELVFHIVWRHPTLLPTTKISVFVYVFAYIWPFSAKHLSTDVCKRFSSLKYALQMLAVCSAN